MATERSTVDFIVEQASGSRRVTAKKMFGECGLYCDGELIALVCDEQLFVKPTVEGRAYLGPVTKAPPYPSAKPCFPIAGEAWDDADWLSELFKLTAAVLPVATPKKSRGKSGISASPR